MKKEIQEVLEEYSGISAETKSIFGDFEALDKDEKPAVHIEIYYEEGQTSACAKFSTSDATLAF